MNDATRRDPDTIRDAEVQDVTGYDLTTQEVVNMFAEGLVPRSLRQIQRMCASGDLDCKRYNSSKGVLLKINRDSVERKIIEIQQIQNVELGHDMSRHTATAKMGDDNVAQENNADDTSSMSRHTATYDDMETRRRMSSQAQSDEPGDDKRRRTATVATGDDAIVAALRELLAVKEDTIRELRTQRQSDLEHYNNIREFLHVQMEDVFAERRALREEVAKLRSLNAPEQEVLPGIEMADDTVSSDHSEVMAQAEVPNLHTSTQTDALSNTTPISEPPEWSETSAEGRGEPFPN